jgi:transcriptional regulator with XRE-family HTH domain
MLSKIENGNISPSLTTLQSLSRALGVPVTAFFRRYEEPRNAVFVKAGEGVELERRGTRAGHQYNLLGHIDNNTAACHCRALSDHADGGFRYIPGVPA